MKTKKAMFLGVIILLMVSLILLLGCAETKTYSKYGFSFEYPRTFSVTETGILENEANDTSGIVQVFTEENEEIKIFQVAWGIAEIEPDELEDALVNGIEEGFIVFETDEGIASYERGERVETTKAGHLLFYQYYAANSTEGDEVYGVISCFYCDESPKFFSLVTADNTISAMTDALGDFQNYLDSFVCH